MQKRSPLSRRLVVLSFGELMPLLELDWPLGLRRFLCPIRRGELVHLITVIDF